MMDNKGKISAKNLPSNKTLFSSSNSEISSSSASNSARSTPRSISNKVTPSKTQPPPKTGRYAVTTVRTMSWLSTPPVKQDKPKGRKPRAQMAVIIPFFAECAEEVYDSYWKSILTQCSYGKFPKGFSYRNSYLTFKRNGRPDRIQLLDSAEESAPIIIDFFRSKAGMRSELDAEREKRELTGEYSDEQQILKNKWSEVSQKCRTQSINAFIDSIAFRMKLNMTQKNKLTTIVNLGFILGYFTSDHVSYSDGTISSIVGIAYNPETQEFIFDPSKINTKNFAKTKKKIITEDVYMNPNCKPSYEKQIFINFYNLWISYIASLTKNSPKIRSTTEATEDTSEVQDDTVETTQDGEETQDLEETQDVNGISNS